MRLPPSQIISTNSTHTVEMNKIFQIVKPDFHHEPLADFTTGVYKPNQIFFKPWLKLQHAQQGFRIIP